MIYYESISSPIGDLFFGIKEQGICSLSFLGKEKIAEKNIPSSKQIKLFQLLKQELQEYFLKKREKFTVPLLLDGTIFQKNSWEQLQKIPYGQTITYQQQAIFLKKPKAIRAVANSNASNKIPILIPCRRVIGKDGSLTGYTGGIWRKKFLLELDLEIKTLV